MFYYFFSKYQCQPYIQTHLKYPAQKLMRVFPTSSLMMPVSLSKYKGTVGMFNNLRFESGSLSYSCFNKKYHNHNTFTLAVGLFNLIFCQLINVLSNWKFISRFLPDLVGICYFSRKILYLSKNWCLRLSHLAQSYYYQVKC